MLQRLVSILLALSLTASLFAQSDSSIIEKYLDLVNNHFEGERAYTTTHFVSEQWRLPGNHGFDTSIYYVQQILKEAGFVLQEEAKPGQAHYRLERYPLRRPTWEPVDAQLFVQGVEGPILDFSSNRNMIAINSFSTPPEGLQASVVFVESCSTEAIKKAKVKGKVVAGKCNVYQLFRSAVLKEGALGVLAYSIPKYNQPEKYQHSIPFKSIGFNSEAKAWGINLSYAAWQALQTARKKGKVEINTKIQTKIYSSEELTLVAEIPGQEQSEERFVFSAHVQEPGANDNASGVGTLAEMARVAINLYHDERIRPRRTLTFLWGDEILSTRRFIQQDKTRATGIKWGLSLDMVGEDTEKTGGTFLIEKMPDPSAIWTRGEDKHTEWGASPVSKSDLNPHYFNDFMERVCRQQAKRTDWVVNTNPFEGGSDHQPFLNAKIPGLLFWHFTDVFYHTDADRIDKVSPKTLYNVGVSALASALVLTEGGEEVALELHEVLQTAADKRLNIEKDLSVQALRKGAKYTEEEDICNTWIDWYLKSTLTIKDVLLGTDSPKLEKKLRQATKRLLKTQNETLRLLKQ